MPIWVKALGDVLKNKDSLWELLNTIILQSQIWGQNSLKKTLWRKKEEEEGEEEDSVCLR